MAFVAAAATTAATARISFYKLSISAGIGFFVAIDFLCSTFIRFGVDYTDDYLISMRNM